MAGVLWIFRHRKGMAYIWKQAVGMAQAVAWGVHGIISGGLNSVFGRFRRIALGFLCEQH